MTQPLGFKQQLVRTPFAQFQQRQIDASSPRLLVHLLVQHKIGICSSTQTHLSYSYSISSIMNLDTWKPVMSTPRLQW